MEKYSIIYSSKTGNTELLATHLKKILPERDRVYYGNPSAEACHAGLLMIGFWTDKGTCDEEMAAFLKNLRNKKIFLFGTAGFGGSESYFSGILSRIETLLDASNTVIGTFMCQGKMPMTVRKRYESMLEKDPEKMQPLIDNFDLALSHPDEEDLKKFEKLVQTSNL